MRFADYDGAELLINLQHREHAVEYELDYNGGYTVAQAPADARALFIRRTYTHLGGAILAFMAIEAVLLNLPGIDAFMDSFYAMGRGAFFIVLLGFMAISWLADYWARSDTSRGMQYAGLGLYVVAEAVIFLPMLWLANTYFAGEHVIANAAIMTLAVFGGLTVVTFISKSDFSFLRGILCVASFGALGVIVAALIFGFPLGIWFSLAMVGFASAVILYQTSMIIHHYRTDQYVAAALGLFSSVALLFWYILRIFMSRR